MAGTCYARLLLLHLLMPPAAAVAASAWLHNSTRLFSLTEILLGHVVPHRPHKHVCHRHKKPKHISNQNQQTHTHMGLWSLVRKSICFDCVPGANALLNSLSMLQWQLQFYLCWAQSKNANQITFAWNIKRFHSIYKNNAIFD